MTAKDAKAHELGATKASNRHPGVMRPHVALRFATIRTPSGALVPRARADVDRASSGGTLTLEGFGSTFSVPAMFTRCGPPFAMQGMSRRCPP